MVKSYWWWGGGGGGLCDFIVTPVPIGLAFQFLTGLGLVLGLEGLDLGLGLDNCLDFSLLRSAFCSFRSI